MSNNNKDDEEETTTKELWVDDPLILVKRWKNLNPVDKKASPTEKFNASARLIILVSGLASLLTRKWKYLGIGSIALVGMYWLTKNRQQQRRRNNRSNMIVEPPSSNMGNTNTNKKSQPPLRRQRPLHYGLLNRRFNPHAVVNDPIGNPDIYYPQQRRDPFHPNVHDRFQYREGIENPYDPIWMIGRQTPTSVTPVPYDPLGNEQTFFGFDSGLTDPAFSQNKYNSELEDRMMHYPRINYRNQVKPSTHQQQEQKREQNPFNFQPNRQDPRSEFFDGVPHYY